MEKHSVFHQIGKWLNLRFVILIITAVLSLFSVLFFAMDLLFVQAPANVRIIPIQRLYDKIGIVLFVLIFPIYWITVLRIMDKRSQRRDSAEDLAGRSILASVSHEMRTPLHAILGYVQLLERVELLPEHREFVEEIRDAGLHLLDIINDTLNLSATELGQTKLNFEYIPLLDTVNNCLRLINPLIQDKEIIVFHHTEDISSELNVFADRIILKKILLNLLSNAIKYNRSNGSVNIYYEQEGRRVKIHISDTGIGIDPSEWERVFELFYRIRDEDIRAEGNGIGLPLSKEMAELIGGSIELDSIPEKGSRFSVILPISNTKQKP